MHPWKAIRARRHRRIVKIPYISTDQRLVTKKNVLNTYVTGNKANKKLFVLTPK